MVPSLAAPLSERLLVMAGLAHLASLAAILFAPVHLRWAEELQRLPRLLSQMCNVYSHYTSGTILGMGLVSVFLPGELAGGSPLARAVCGYIAFFWAVRLCLQFYYDADPHLASARLKASYHLLTALFVGFVSLYGWLAIRS